MAGAAGLSQLPRKRRLINQLTTRVVGLGGAAVIAAIALIFFYLLWVVAPIFASAEIEVGPRLDLDTGEPLLVDVNDSDEVGLRVTADGRALFFDVVTGEARGGLDLERPLAAAQPVGGSNGLYALQDQAGAIGFIQSSYPVSFDGDVRSITPLLDPAFGDDWLELGNVDSFDVLHRDFEVLVASIAGSELTIHRFRDAELGFALERPRRGTLPLSHGYDRVYFGPRGRQLYLIAMDGAIQVLDLARPTAPISQYRGRLVPEGARIGALAPLLGSYSLLVADQQGTVGQWFMVRGESGSRFERVREFEVGAAVQRIVPEPRRKGFAVLDADQRLHLFYTTSERHLAELKLADADVATAVISPRSDLMLTATANGTVQSYRLDNEHPEISWSTLWSQVWYEGYEAPVHSWQSSSADTAFEPKFSLSPLLFGTLKGAFYAMLFAVPVAIMGALYTAYFMAAPMRRIVKPGIEIMAALPTVILGFLAGLWLAPLIETHLTAVLSLILIMPLLTLLTAWGWALLPERITKPWQGWYALLVLPVLVATIWVAFAIGPWLETALFAGNVQAWILEHVGLGYDQRNALVVGLAMGLAVIPTIFSIAEDAIYGVPTHLINGSLALGATPWQTLLRVVVLTASPGIFSAVMIGLGRAVGETMIVLMATGNTPIMDMNVFEGMRTFAANIAVELPEAEVDSSHYRILFLTALVLFLLTFLFNTVAEVVRQRLRRRYGSL